VAARFACSEIQDPGSLSPRTGSHRGDARFLSSIAWNTSPWHLQVLSGVPNNCVDPATLNVVPGGGHFVHDALRAHDPAGAKWRGACVVNGVNGSCTGEQAFADPAILQTAIYELDGKCKPLAR
jgi:hypothetical protein